MCQEICLRAKRVPSFTYLARNMKRSMSQSTMCLKCFEPVQIGWQQKHHIRQCTGRPDATNFILAKETVEPTGEDQPNNELFAVNAAGDNLLAAIDEGTHQRATLGADEVEREPAKKKLQQCWR